jgi:membrane-bound metal-dependent hydrolase YbcI (DUF457 family)
MILPGHLAAPYLASRRIRISPWLAMLAGVVPDLVDKTLFYVLHHTQWTRIPAHSLFFWVATSLAVAGLGRWKRRDWLWGASWAIGYGLHLALDLVPPGELPWFWPFNSYASYVSTDLPWFLGGGPVPWVQIIAEFALTVAALVVLWRQQSRSRAHRRQEG